MTIIAHLFTVSLNLFVDLGVYLGVSFTDGASPMPLSDIKIRTAKPAHKPYKLFDGGGLFLLVNPNGSKLWRQKYRYLGKERLHAIGAYPTVKIKWARIERDKVKYYLHRNLDPSLSKKKAKNIRKFATDEELLDSLLKNNRELTSRLGVITKEVDWINKFLEDNGAAVKITIYTAPYFIK